MNNNIIGQIILGSLSEGFIIMKNSIKVFTFLFASQLVLGMEQENERQEITIKIENSIVTTRLETHWLKALANSGELQEALYLDTKDEGLIKDCGSQETFLYITEYDTPIALPPHHSYTKSIIEISNPLNDQETKNLTVGCVMPSDDDSCKNKSGISIYHTEQSGFYIE